MALLLNHIEQIRINVNWAGEGSSRLDGLLEHVIPMVFQEVDLVGRETDFVHPVRFFGVRA